MDPPEDQLELGKFVSQPYTPRLNQILEKHQEVFALDKGCAASKLPLVEIELLPGASAMRVQASQYVCRGRAGWGGRSQGDAGQGSP